MQIQITTGKIQSAQKIVIYGPEGIGKSTFAARFPQPVFIDTEGSTKHMDVARMPAPSSWQMILEQVRYIKSNPHLCKTLVIDTADWAENLAATEICAKADKKGIEDFGYGKGYVFLAEEFGRLLNLLTEVVNLGINVVMTAHAKMRKFEQPDEMGSYDRWEMKLGKGTGPIVKEWADIVLFANYKTYVIKTDEKKNKAQGGTRVMHTTHHVCWDAKNRHDLPDELPFDYAKIAHCIPDIGGTTTPSNTSQEQTTPPPADMKLAQESPQQTLTDIPNPLADLMISNNVTPEEIQRAVASKGYYPIDTPISRYEPDFVNGVLVGAWPQVFSMIETNRAKDIVGF